MMAQFKMVKYHKRKYPASIPLHIQEVAGHFDIATIRANMPYSLHTEYSYGKRQFSSTHLYSCNEILGAHQSNVPQLWKNEQWALELASYIIDATRHLPSPSVIEIHPPFDDYTADLRAFIPRYQVFEERIRNQFPEVEIHIENRCGSNYRSGKFAVSTLPQMVELSEYIAREKLALRIALDIPQLYTAHNVTTKTSDSIVTLLEYLMGIREYIAGVHLWGKNAVNGRRIAHHGTLDTYFMGKTELKTEFLNTFYQLFDDSITRNLVLEVNSTDEDMQSIISDLDSIRIRYV